MENINTTSIPKYLPGFEPDDIKPLVDSFFTVINKAFPDKVIVTSEWNHQAWDNAANMLCKKLGYSKGKDFLEAYGFSVVNERQAAELTSKKQSSIQNVPPVEYSELNNMNLNRAKQAKNKKAHSRFSTVLLITIIILMVAVAIISIIAIRKVTQRVTSSSDDANVLFGQPNSSYSDGSDSKPGKSRTVDDINADISIASMDKSANNFESLEKLYLECIELPDSEQRKIVGDTLTNAFSQSIVDKVCKFKNNDNDIAEEITKKYKDILSDEQIKTCLISVGRWGSVEYAESYLKKHLKSPRSYIRYSGTVETPELAESGKYYTVEVVLDFGVTNALGGEIRDKVSIYQNFTINNDDASVHYTSAEAKGLTKYYITLGEGIYYSGE